MKSNGLLVLGLNRDDCVYIIDRVRDQVIGSIKCLSNNPGDKTQEKIGFHFSQEYILIRNSILSRDYSSFYESIQKGIPNREEVRRFSEEFMRKKGILWVERT